MNLQDMLTIDDLRSCAKQVIEEAEWLDDNDAIPDIYMHVIHSFVEAARDFLEQVDGD